MGKTKKISQWFKHKTGDAEVRDDVPYDTPAPLTTLSGISTPMKVVVSTNPESTVATNTSPTKSVHPNPNKDKKIASRNGMETTKSSGIQQPSSPSGSSRKRGSGGQPIQSQATPLSSGSSHSSASSAVSGSASEDTLDSESNKPIVINHPTGDGGRDRGAGGAGGGGGVTRRTIDEGGHHMKGSADNDVDMTGTSTGLNGVSESHSFARDYVSRDIEYAVPQVNHGHLNSLFNGHLMKWKYESEEGTPFVRIPAFFGGLGLIGTTVASLVLYQSSWTISSFVISFFVFAISFTVCILDGRFLSASPLSWRAHLRNVVTRHFNIFRFLWGRSLLYLASGLLSCALLQLLTIISGAVMLFIGFISLCVGSYASRKFSSLRNSLADESFLLLEFSNFDYNDDGYLTPPEFSALLSHLGMELDDRYSLKAFNAIDNDHDRKISFEEFSGWWNNGYIERGRRDHGTRGRSEDTDDYHRLH